MHSSVNPRRFVGQPVLLHHLSPRDFTAVADGLRVGRVNRIGQGKTEGWLWALTGPHCGWAVEGTPVSGIAATPVAARQQLTRSFEAWLAWALAQDGAVHWHWTEAGASLLVFTPAGEARAA